MHSISSPVQTESTTESIRLSPNLSLKNNSPYNWKRKKTCTMQIEISNMGTINKNLKRPKDLPFMNTPDVETVKKESSKNNSSQPNVETSPSIYYTTTPSPPSLPATRIFDFLYLGSYEDACTPHTYESLGITDVINLTTNNTPPPCNLISFLRIAIDDNQHDSLLPHLPSALALIESTRRRGGVILVHCMAGVSRSPSLVLAYLITHHCMTLSCAYQFVKSKRPIIAPNFNFLGQLVTIEQQQKLLGDLKSEPEINDSGENNSTRTNKTIHLNIKPFIFNQLNHNEYQTISSSSSSSSSPSSFASTPTQSPLNASYSKSKSLSLLLSKSPKFCCIRSSPIDHPSPLDSFEIQVS